MTDRGTRARWTTAALIAPTAAALFTGTTVWAAGHSPVAVSTTKASPVVDPAVLELRQAVQTNVAQVASLRDTVAAILAQAQAESGGTIPVADPSAAAATTGSTSSSSGSTGGTSTGGGTSTTSKAATTTKTTTTKTTKTTTTTPKKTTTTPTAPKPTVAPPAPKPTVAPPPPAPKPTPAATTGASGAP